MPSDLHIRPPEPGDRADGGRLWTGSLAFHETSRLDAHLDACFARLLTRDRSDMEGLIAARDGAAVGLAHWCLHPHGRQAELVCYLKDLHTDPAVRRTGAGAALVAAVAEASAQGGRGVYWTTAQDDAAARRLHDRVGRLTPFVTYVL